MDSIITQLKTQIEELEKRIKALSLQLGTTNQISAIKEFLQQMHELLKKYQEQLELHCQTEDDRYQQLLSLIDNFNNHLSDFEDYKLDMLSVEGVNNSEHKSLRSGITSNSAEILELKTTVNQISELLSSVQKTIDNLGDVASQKPVKNTLDTIIIYPQEKSSSKYYSPNLPFYADANQILEFEVSYMGYSNVENGNPIFAAFINNVRVDRCEFVTGLASKNFNYTYKFFYNVTQTNNIMYLTCEVSSDCYLYRIAINVKGKNVALANQTNILKILCFNDKYYALKRTLTNSFFLGPLTKEQFSINSNTGYKTYVNSKLPINTHNMFFSPATKPDTDIVTQHPDYDYFLPYIKPQSGCDIACGIYTESNNSIESNWSWSAKCSSLDVLPAGFKNSDFPNGVGTSLLSVTSLSNPICCGSGFYKTLQYNNTEIKNILTGSFVKNINMKIGDHMDKFHGVVLWNGDNMNVYYPDINSKYCVEIGPGKNTTAFYQPEDKSINVYIYDDNKITKYKLVYDEHEQKYSLSDEKKYLYNYIRVEEIYDGKGFATKLNNNNYEIIDDLISKLSDN